MESIGLHYKANGDVIAGDAGDAYLLMIEDGSVRFGRDVTVEWDGDSYTVRSPHTPSRMSGWAGSTITNHETRESVETVQLIRELDGLPRGTSVRLPWAKP